MTYLPGLGHKTGKKDVEHQVLSDIGTVEDYLQRKSYLMGEQVCLADCAVFAFLVVSQQAKSLFTKY